MRELLVISPSGLQVIIQVRENGNYYDETKILWDTSVDGDFPQNLVLGKMERQGAQLVLLQDYIASHKNALLSELRALKIDEMWAEYESRAHTDITVGQVTYKGGEQYIALLSQVLATGGVSSPAKWWDINDNEIVVTYQDLVTLGEAIRDRNWPLYANFIAKKVQIKQENDPDILQAITWD